MAACDDLPEGYVSRGRRVQTDESETPSERMKVSDITASNLDKVAEAKTIMEDPEKMKAIIRSIEKDDSIISETVNVMETNPALKRKAIRAGKSLDAKKQLDALSQSERRKLVKKVKAAHRGATGGAVVAGLTCQIVGVTPGRKFKHVKVKPEFLELEPWKNWTKVELDDNIIVMCDPEDKTVNRLSTKILGKSAGHNIVIYGCNPDGTIFCPEISKLESKYKR